MPSKPTSFQRLPEILDVLRGMDSIHLDRQGVEQLFGVGERRARQLIAGLPGVAAVYSSNSRQTTFQWSIWFTGAYH